MRKFNPIFLCLSLVAAPMPAISQDQANEIARSVITEVGSDLDDIRELIDELSTAPIDARFLGRDRQDVQDDLDGLLDDIIVLLVGSDYQSSRSRLFEIDEKMNSLKLEIEQLKVDSISAEPSPTELSRLDRALGREYAGGSVEAIAADIREKSAELEGLTRGRDEIERTFRALVLDRYEIALTPEQARSVLYQINGQSIVEASIAFSVLRQIEDRFAEIRATTDSDVIIRRYYAIAAALRLVTVRLYERHLQMYDGDWLPSLEKLATDNGELIAETESALLDSSSEERRAGYQNNLQIQEKLGDVINQYRELLFKRQRSVEARLAEAEMDAALAINTLRTLENAAILNDQFNISEEEFDALTTIETGDLIPLDDEEIFDSFIDISRQLQGSS